MRRKRTDSGSLHGYGPLAAALLEAAPDAILVVDAEGKIVLVNRQCEKLFGYPRTELIGAPVESLVPEGHREAHQAHRRDFEKGAALRRMAESRDLYAETRGGKKIPVEVALSPTTFEGEHLVIAIVRDARSQRAFEDELRFAGTHDALTGLYNRAFLVEERRRLERGRTPVGVVVADVDGLKPVNDEHGHAEGDRLLRRTAKVLESTFRDGDIIARVGGDEFCVLLPGIAEATLPGMIERLAAHVEVENTRSDGPALSLSAGAAMSGPVSPGPATLSEAIRQADERMYANKRRRRPSSRAPVQRGAE